MHQTAKKGEKKGRPGENDPLTTKENNVLKIHIPLNPNLNGNYLETYAMK